MIAPERLAQIRRLAETVDGVMICESCNIALVDCKSNDCCHPEDGGCNTPLVDLDDDQLVAVAPYQDALREVLTELDQQPQLLELNWDKLAEEIATLWNDTSHSFVSRKQSVLTLIERHCTLRKLNFGFGEQVLLLQGSDPVKTIPVIVFRQCDRDHLDHGACYLVITNDGRKDPIHVPATSLVRTAS